MAEANENGNGPKLQKAAESAALQLVSRWMVVVGFPAMFAVSVWAGQRIVTQIDEFVREARQEFRYNDQRMNGFDVRLTGVEKDVEHLKARP